ncbi:MAG: Lrp/AsnC family transcriptional regulator [Alphaproteobacteria bacterium]|nr:Lrp/AsnC family transcriptional regulator [Alphaproteobacteria bacterium]
MGDIDDRGGVVSGESRALELDRFGRDLLDGFQRDLPLTPRPFAEIADRLGVAEDDVLDGLRRLTEAGAVSRVGAVVAPHSVGWSTLAAMAVPAERLEDVAASVSAIPEVNHNYQREHRFNLWFVVTGCDRDHVAAVLDGIEARSGCQVLDLPLLESYHIDLGFDLRWN